MLKKVESSSDNLYETDFYAWASEQVHLLNSQAWGKLDIVNLVEEIESL